MLLVSIMRPSLMQFCREIRGSIRQWTGLVAKQAIDAFVHKAPLPTPYAGLRLARHGHDRRGAQALTDAFRNIAVSFRPVRLTD